MIPAQEKVPYLDDGDLYGIWKYLNGFRLVQKSLLKFEDVTPLEHSTFLIAKFIGLLQDIGIKKRNGLIFHKDIYLSYNGTLYENLKKTKTENKTSFGAKALEYLECIINGDVETLYRSDMRILDLIFYEKTIQVSEFFEFSTTLLPKDKKRLENFIKAYIESFINDTLQKDKENFYRFEKQKSDLLGRLSSYNSQYGQDFIFEYPQDFDLLTGADKEFLFIHTLISLEYLGYLEIEKLWIFDMDLLPDKQTESYKIKINLKDKFLEERSMSTSNISEKRTGTKNNTFKLDEKRGILHFTGKEITISKAGKESYPLQLLQTLNKEWDRYWFEDEILEDWGYSNSEIKTLPKNRVYFAAIKVNNNIQKETQIKDFIEHTTRKFRINPKYKKLTKS